MVRTRGTDVTTRELAEAAQVAEGTLFRVFEDKDSLVREAVAAALDPSEDIKRLAAIDLDLPLEDRVTEALRYGAARVGDITLWTSLVHRLGRDPAGPRGRHDPATKAQWAERQRAVMAQVREQMRRLLEPDAGRLRHPVDTVVELLELTLAGAIAQSAGRARQGLEARPLDPQLLTDFFLSGVVVPAAPAHQPQP